MAQRRMFSPKIVGSDAFLDMPQSTQLLYFHLGMYADDDGFINPRKIMRMVGTSQDDLKILVAKRFLLEFEDGVIVIKHWTTNNLIRKDWYQETNYKELKKTLFFNENGDYTDKDPQSVNNSLTIRQHSIGKDSIGKDSIGKDSIGNTGSVAIANSTPKEEAKFFFDNTEQQKIVFKGMIDKGIPEDIARKELWAFINYWVELDKSGKKQRWELQKTFELNRRIATWFSRSGQFNKYNNLEKKGISL